MLGVKRCPVTLRRQTMANTPRCMEPCDDEVCVRHTPFTTTIISHEHVIEGTNVIIDITTNKIMGWVDDSNILHFNCNNSQESMIADKYDLRVADQSERDRYSKGQK